jgi:sulfite reductase (NADPH) hemoprotein beta-component
MYSDPSAVKLTRQETLKGSDPSLAGAIAQSLADPALESFSQDDTEFLKFHGIYQQDDRDKRKSGKHFMLMVRTRFPGGTLSAKQYLACDELSTRYGNNTMRITSRQDFQFHGVLKANLRQTIKSLNQALVTTLAACGDVARNVMAPPTPATSPLVDRVLDEARKLSSSLAPATSAYHSLWLEGQELDLDDQKTSFVDPLYGQNYLPRKFKCAFAIPPLNDVDIFTHDLGFVVIAENGTLAGYNVLAGGGMGMSHGNTQTFPRLADVLGFVPPEHLELVARTVLAIHRDFGDRTNRKHARLKYVLQERGAEWCRQEIEKRTGAKLESPRPFQFTKQGVLLGWRRQSNGKFFLGLFIENGRVRDLPGCQLKRGLRRVIEEYQPDVRFTPTGNLLLVNVPGEHQEGLSRILREHGVSVENAYSPTRLASMACVALPTCGLALAESERVLPDIITRIEQVLEEVGLKGEAISVRMTGCPNGCSRPYMAEVGLVGKAPDKYQVYLGGNESSTRLNRLYKEGVKSADIPHELRPLLARFAAHRAPGERFGDFCHRMVLPPAGV